MTKRTRAQIKADMETRIPTNDRGLITAAVMRNQLTDFVDSMLMEEDGVGGNPTTPVSTKRTVERVTAIKTLALGDMGKYLLVDSADDLVITFPNNAQPGDLVTLRRQNTGHVAWAFVTGASAQLPVSKAGHSRIAERYGEAELFCVSNSNGTSAIWSVTGSSATAAPPVSDTTPEPFLFNDVAAAELSTVYISNGIIVKGIGAPSVISIVGGSYSINDGPFVTTAGTVVENDVVKVRVTSSASNTVAVAATLTIGGVSDIYTVTTKANVTTDTTPDPLVFTTVTSASAATQYDSNTITITGINAAAAISITGGAYSKNSGAFTTSPGTIGLGDTLQLRLTSSASLGVTTTAEVTVGGVTGQFSVTTAAVADTTPDSFNLFLEDNSDVTPNSLQTSPPFTVTGINTSVSVTVSGGAWNKNGGTFTTAPGVAVQGDVIRLQTTAPSTGATAKRVDIAVGNTTGYWRVITQSTGETPPVSTGSSPQIDDWVWKITMPYDANGFTYATSATPGVATEIWPGGTPDLFALDNAYYDQQADGSVIFAVPTNGATTSGSSYARTEFRELNSAGTTEFEWTAATGGKLDAELAILEMPTLTNGTENKVVIGQVHGPDDEMCRLTYWAGSGKISFFDDKAIPESGTTPTEREFVLKDVLGNETAIPLNAYFAYKIEVDDDMCKCSVFYDGKTYTASSPLSAFWADKLLYFKAGLYLQVGRSTGSSTNRGNGQAKARFTRIIDPVHGWDF